MSPPNDGAPAGSPEPLNLAKPAQAAELAKPATHTNPAKRSFLARLRGLFAPLRTTRGRLALAGTLAYFAVQLAGTPGIGLTDDDDFYIPAGRTYAQWFERAVTGPFKGDTSAWSRGGVAAAYNCGSCNREHPPLAKWAIGAGVHVLTDKLGVMPDYLSGRLGIVLLSTLLAYLLFRMAFDTYGALAALFAQLALLTLPRFFFHSHVPTLDVAVATTYFLAVYAFWRARRSFVWGLFAGVAFGFALLSKLNAPFMLLPLGAYAILRIRDVRVTEGQLRVPAMNVALPAMLVLGPILFFGLWPRLWFDTFKNLGDYIQFHLHHYGIYFYYLGTIYNEVYAPWHAPFVMAGITTPIVTLGFGVGGVAVALSDIFSRVGRALSLEQVSSKEGARHDDAALPNPAGVGSENSDIVSAPSGRGEQALDRRDLGLLVLLNAATCIGVVAFSKIPKYGGVKLFLPFFPFFALLAGVAFARLVALVMAMWPRLGTRPLATGGAALVLAMTPAAIDLYRAHPYHLSYYGPLVGGLRGATSAGFERQYYDVLYLSLADWLQSKYAKTGVRVHFMPNNKEYARTFPYLHKAGRLARGIRVVGGVDQAELLILTHERRWREYPELFERYQARPVLWELAVDRVPLLTVYALK